MGRAWPALPALPELTTARSHPVTITGRDRGMTMATAIRVATGMTAEATVAATVAATAEVVVAAEATAAEEAEAATDSRLGGGVVALNGFDRDTTKW